MIFFACIIGAAVLFGIVFFISRTMDKMSYGALYDALSGFGTILLVVASLLVIAANVMGIVILVGNSGTDAKMEDLRQRGEILEYQVENDLYDNDNDLGKKELYSEIEDYNSTIVKGKVMQNDFWYGIFYPDIYDHLEPIDYKK